MTRPPMTPMSEPLRPSVVADVTALDCSEPLDTQLCRELYEQVRPEYHWERAHGRSGVDGVAVASSGWDAEDV